MKLQKMDVAIPRKIGLGANGPATLDRYGHLMPGRAQDVAERLDALARAAIVDPIPEAGRLDARVFRGMEPARRRINLDENTS